MLDRIKRALEKNSNVSGYTICENITEANELFFIKKNVDMDRAKRVHNFIVTVYKDFEVEEKKFKGSAMVNIHPTMTDVDIDKTIEEAVFAAQFVKNEYYPLVKTGANYRSMEESSFSKESLPYGINEVTKAVYAKDNYEKGGINSCEIFLNKTYTHLLNSEGVDVENTGYSAMVEFITTWKEEGCDEVELYRCLEFSELDAHTISTEVEEMIITCRHRAIAKNTPRLKSADVILTNDAVKKLFEFYNRKTSAASVYSGSSTWKLGDKIQGEQVKGDKLTIELDPFMKKSTMSAVCDSYGFALEPVRLIEAGVLNRYSANVRYAHYINVEPTGDISNIRVLGGSKTIEELKMQPHIEVVAFSDFTVDDMTGDFCGEIRLAYYFDGEKTTAVAGGSISGNLNEVQNEMYLSKELQNENNFEGPKAIKLLNVTVAGVE